MGFKLPFGLKLPFGQPPAPPIPFPFGIEQLVKEIQTGTVVTDSDSWAHVTFDPAFSSRPFVVARETDENVESDADLRDAKVGNITKEGFDIRVVKARDGGRLRGDKEEEVEWLAILV